MKKLILIACIFLCLAACYPSSSIFASSKSQLSDEKWYQHAWRRNVLDMHIPDWNPEFLSKFDPNNYIDMLKLAGAQSAVVYTHSHAGACFYPTKVGHMHQNLKGRDIFGEVLNICHKNNIKVVAYFSLIFDTWAYRNHPDFKIIDADGCGVNDKSRYGVCCLNSPYRDYVVAHIRELCQNYDFDGIRFDMTFWPDVCHCKFCKEKYQKEVGGQIPTEPNWSDPNWVKFQRARERWLTEFAALATSTVKAIKPNVSVEHQCSTLLSPWIQGSTVDLFDNCDFLQGDFYGGKLQSSFVNKLLYNLTKNKPHGFETSSAVSLRDFTILKSPELLKAKAFCAMANSGAFIFIDTIDPAGTINPAPYSRLRDVWNQTKPYEKYLGGDLIQDVAIYISTESKFNLGKENMPHIESATSAAQALIYDHIPFGVITRKNLDRLNNYQVIILPDILMISPVEAEALRNYVRQGGSIYASKYTSLVTTDGVKHDNFLLADVFGANFSAVTKENYTFISPAAEGKGFFDGFNDKYPFGLNATQFIVKADPNAQILANIILPYTDPADFNNFASIHCNPPGKTTDYPALIRNKFGRGLSIYSTANFEVYPYAQKYFAKIIRSLAAKPLFFDSDAPKSVEITAFDQPENDRIIVNMLNFQEELPNIPVGDFNVRIYVGDKKVKNLLILPAEKKIPYKFKNGYLEFTHPVFETFSMFAINFKK
jgi:hypothetical protein